jgi:hypothetical protein
LNFILDSTLPFMDGLKPSRNGNFFYLFYFLFIVGLSSNRFLLEVFCNLCISIKIFHSSKKKKINQRVKLYVIPKSIRALSLRALYFCILECSSKYCHFTFFEQFCHSF